jgi:hypothetical protein
MLTDEQVMKFQTIYKNRFGKEISREDALDRGIKLVRLMKLIYTPITEKEFVGLQERRQEIANK